MLTYYLYDDFIIQLKYNSYIYIWYCSKIIFFNYKILMMVFELIKHAIINIFNMIISECAVKHLQVYNT